MERHEILEVMSELKLYGMRASFDEIAGKGLNRRDELYPLIASLLRAERTHRQARSISYRISGAKFPVLKDLDSFVFIDTPVDEGRGVCPMVCVNDAVGDMLSGLKRLRPESDQRTGSQTAPSRRSIQPVASSGYRRCGSPGTRA